ncbi:MAG: DUF3795 domain-containing protein [candidate division WOR-3 bacterium]|nr:DUF3795 domain-containing protein [candidate division WOR-3 bacterium]
MSDPLACFCGDYCGKCPNYPRKCAGCVPELHPDCHFIRCCQDKGIEHCGFCENLPCQKLAGFCPDDRPSCPPGYHIENLRERKRIGTEAWFEKQRAKWG